MPRRNDELQKVMAAQGYALMEDLRRQHGVTAPVIARLAGMAGLPEVKVGMLRYLPAAGVAAVVDEYRKQKAVNREKRKIRAQARHQRTYEATKTPFQEQKWPTRSPVGPVGNQERRAEFWSVMRQIVRQELASLLGEYDIAVQKLQSATPLKTGTDG